MLKFIAYLTVVISADTINKSAESDGWILELETSNFDSEKKELMDNESYKKHAESEAH